jgi:hypothetical protein
MDTTINNEMFNSLLDRVERLANPLNAPAPVPEPKYKITEIPIIPQPIKDKLRRINDYSKTAGVVDNDTWYMLFGREPEDNVSLTEFRQILSALGIEG